ncbi:MAG: indole-3-glycerol phosphate synthase TrpC [Pseudomonadota bacterium]
MALLKTTGTALDAILAYKVKEVAARKSETDLAGLLKRADAAPPPRGFATALTTVAAVGDNALICELKRKSPSAGDILPGADPCDIARDYEAGGAACLSVLTDGPSFGGSLDDLTDIAGATPLPLLRKDFMVDPWQVIEARAHGADAILIIMSAVDDALARSLGTAARDQGMDVLVETHTAAEVSRALTLAPDLLGVNNRDLKTMTTDLGVTARLAPSIPKDVALVSESGIAAPSDIIQLRESGARRFLIGESLMKQPDRAAATRRLREAGRIDPEQERV